MPAPCEEIIDDIEDLISSQDITPKQRYSSKKSVTIRRRKQQPDSASKIQEAFVPNVEHSVIPGTQKVYVKTWGCTHNTSDSEYMAGQLAAYGYKIVSDEEKNSADVWLLNSCTVKNPAEDHFRNEVKAAQDLGKAVVVAGCVPQGAPRSEYLHGVSTVGVQQIDRVVEVVEETLKGNTVRLLGSKRVQGHKLGGAPLELPKVRRNPLVEIIPISTGCLNQCTYCKTKHARGELGSYPPEEIVARAKQAWTEGVCEVWLTSEDTGAYGRDIGTNLPELLRGVADTVPSGCMLRLGMTNPPYILEHLPEMAELLSHPRVYSFLHVPVQSGSDGVLADMKREYCRADFEHVVTFLRDRVSGINIATDIICGFPTETEADFAETLDLCSKFKFPSLFINQFFPRPGTPAARMERVPPAEVKKRTKQLSELFLSYEPYAGREGDKFPVLVTEVSHDREHYVGHNKNYEQVLVPKRADILGKSVMVRVTSTRRHCMIAEILDEEMEPRWQGAQLSATMCMPEDTKRVSLLLPCAGIALAVLFRMFWLLLEL